VAVPVALLAVFVTGQLLGNEPDEPTAPYATAVVAAFGEVNPALLSLAETASRWSTGDANDEALSGALDGAEARLPDARASIAALDEPRGATPARSLFLATVDLYAVYVDVLRETLRAEDDQRSGELDLLARRTRTIADRLYDRAQAIVASGEAFATPGVTVVRSDPVPDWDEDGLASRLDAGRALDRDARAQPDDEPGRRRALRLLVLAEAERAAELDLDHVVDELEAVARSLDDG